MSDLLNLCTLTTNEQKTILAAELTNADRNTIEQCIAQQNCQSWFLERVFMHRHDNDQLLCRQIVQHVNCTLRIAAIINYCKPDLLKGSPISAKLQQAQFIQDSQKEWNKLTQKNENAGSLANYMEVLFIIRNSFYFSQVSPFPFCEISQDKMQNFYRRTPHIVFEKFSEHPHTISMKAAYSPIELIAQQLPKMTPAERSIVARRNDLTTEVKQALSQVDYQPELLNLCTLEEEQSCVFPDELINADKRLIDQCIEQENCQSWFLDKVFKYRNSHDDALCKQILQHDNCPWRIAAIVSFCQPALLESTAVYADIQLANFEPSRLKTWQQLQQKNERCTNLEQYISEVVFKEDRMNHLYHRTPNMVFEKFKDHKETSKFHATYQPIALITQRLSTMKAAERALLTKRNDLTDELKLMLVQDSSKLVRKNILSNTKISNELLLILAQDSNEPIAEKALKLLPKDLQSQINQQKASADSTLDLSNEKSILAYLRFDIAEPTLLAQIAAKASPLFCCAATCHQSADDTVWQAAQQRTDLPQWAQIGLAQYSADSALLDTFIATKNYPIQRALCDNPHLNADQAKLLVKSTKRIELWAAIANRYIEDQDMLEFIINLQGNKSLWLSQLRRCLDPNVTSTELRTIHSNSEHRTLILSRLIARNPRCPIPLMRLYAHYLPEDITKNPGYALKLLEDPKRIKGRPYDGWKVEEYLTQGYGPECLYDWYFNQTQRHDDIRKCPRSRHVNPNKLRPMVLANDSPMQRRFIHEGTQKFSDYEYHMLAYIGSPTLKKNILASELSSNDVVRVLLQDKDRSVVLAAEKMAKKRKLKLPQASNQKTSEKPAKLTLKSLGNKAARLILAKESQETEVLTLLVQDKLPDVRAELAGREDTRPEIWLTLLNDPIDKVSQASFRGWYHRELNEIENAQAQIILQAIVSSTTRNRYLRSAALKRINDVAFTTPLYQQGNGDLDADIIGKTADLTLIENVLFAIERGDPKIKPRWLTGNPNISAEHKARLLTVEPRLITSLIESYTSASDLFQMYQQHRSLIDTYRKSIRFRRLRNINFSAADIQRLYDEIMIDDFITLAAKDLHKLNDQAVINILQATIHHDDFYSLVYNEKYSNTVQTALLTIIEASASLELLSSFAHSYPLPQTLINQYIKGEHLELREAIATYQALNDQQLTLLLHDEFEEVWKALFESEKIDRSRFPNWFLRRLAAIDYDYLNIDDESEALVIEFKNRGMSLQQTNANSGNALIKQFNAKVTVKHFKQLLIDKGLMKPLTRDIEEDEWNDEESKIIGKQTKTIKYNQLTPLAATYGYSCYEEYEEHCTIAYYPEMFPQLLTLLGISVKS